jgi:hypothetical protein
MPRRLVSVDDSFNVPDSVNIREVNLPDNLAATALNATYATKGELSGAGLPKWKANTAYAAADAVLSPNGDIVTAKVAFTSGATYSAANWNLSTTFATPASVQPLVTSALAADPTPANAAAAAVNTELAKANVVRSATAEMRRGLVGWITDDGREMLWMYEDDASLTDHTRRKFNNALLYPKPYIGFWADSFGYEVSSFLATNTGLPVRAWTEGGQTSQRVASRQGGVRALLTLTGNAVPASGPVAVTSWTANPVMGSIGDPRTGFIGGVKGSLTYAVDAGQPTNEFAGTMTFTRIGTGAAVPVSSATEFVSVEENDTDGYGVLMCFTNDKDMTVPIHHTAANIAAMVERFESKVKRVVVIGSFPSSDTLVGSEKKADFDARRNAVKDAVRAQWLDPFLDYFMTDKVFTDMGLTMTADDIADRSNGLVPRQLRSDGIHLTTAAKARLSWYIATAFKARGWIKTVL